MVSVSDVEVGVEVICHSTFRSRYPFKKCIHVKKHNQQCLTDAISSIRTISHQVVRPSPNYVEVDSCVGHSLLWWKLERRKCHTESELHGGRVQIAWRSSPNCAEVESKLHKGGVWIARRSSRASSLICACAIITHLVEIWKHYVMTVIKSIDWFQ